MGRQAHSSLTLMYHRQMINNFPGRIIIIFGANNISLSSCSQAWWYKGLNTFVHSPLRDNLLPLRWMKYLTICLNKTLLWKSSIWEVHGGFAHHRGKSYRCKFNRTIIFVAGYPIDKRTFLPCKYDIDILNLSPQRHSRICITQQRERTSWRRTSAS